MSTTYDFSTVTPRFGAGSGKWDRMKLINPQLEEGIVPFSVADMEFQMAPEIIQTLQQDLNTRILGYTNPTDSYKQTVCNWMERHYAWHAQPEWIEPSHGVVDALFTAVKAYTQPGDSVLLMTPVYYPMYYAIERSNRKIAECALVRQGDTYVIDFDELRRQSSQSSVKLMLLCSPHNPCGRVWTKEELTKIGEICLENHVVVVSDEIHADIIMPGHTHTVFASINEEFAQNSVICTSPSKTFNLAGLQTSNIFIPSEKLREQFHHEMWCCSTNLKCNVLGYVACQAAYEKGEPWMKRMLDVIWTNYQLVKSFLAREFPQITVFQMQGTYLMWMDWNALGYSAEELEHKNRMEAQLFFDEGPMFGKAGQGFERWNLACPTQYVQNALERLKAVYG
ncbi:MAG: MalY/PatB family protein [Butyricicoccus sp.]|nr:MalY/PatB family protein [Butyricicoccus sp.]